MPKIVLIETRAGWMVAPSEALPLTRAYNFRPGVPVDVPDADFDLLTDCTLVEGRSFVPADADYAAPYIVAPPPKGAAAGVSEPPPMPSLPTPAKATISTAVAGPDGGIRWVEYEPDNPPRVKKGG